MPAAARIGDPTSHGPALAPGPGSSDVLIGGQPAWRATPSALTGAVDTLSGAMKSFMGKASMTPASAAADVAKISANMTEVGAAGATAGVPAAPVTTGTQIATLNATNVALTATWTAASAVPGGQAAATAAYTQGIKAAMAAAASAVMSALSAVADMHVCPIPSPTPPHGPGFVTKGSKSVLINNLPAVRQGDKVMETCGGSDAIAMGCPSVLIGDSEISPGDVGQDVAEKSQQKSQDKETPDESEAAEAYRQQAAGSNPVSTPTRASVDGPIAPVRSAEQPAGQKLDFLGVDLRDFDDEPMPLRPFSITLSDGRVLTGETDENGYACFEGIKPGQGEIEVIEIIEEQGDRSEDIDEGELDSMYLDDEPEVVA
ncbi:MAG: PAAR domain-containing protein [Planctomycetota bacterium]|jgi:uncharacterized Zn-binding protein involved in type VI secretion